MKHYDVMISDKANTDIESIYDYIYETLHEPIAALNQYNRITEAILSSEVIPERIRIMTSEPEYSRGIRLLLIDNYAVFFVVKAETVHIVRVLYSASNIQKRLSEE